MTEKAWDLTEEELQNWDKDQLIEAVISLQAFADLTTTALDRITGHLGELVFQAEAVATFPQTKGGQL